MNPGPQRYLIFVYWQKVQMLCFRPVVYINLIKFLRMAETNKLFLFAILCMWINRIKRTQNIFTCKFQVWLIAFQTTIVYATPDSPGKTSDQLSDRSGRSWLHSASSPQTLQQLQQNPPPIFLQTSTNKPGDSVSSSDNGGRHFEEQDKTAIPAASEQDFLSRHYGYMNIHRFDPNYPYYERPPFPRYGEVLYYRFCVLI